jgi:hypothetical protein
VSRRFPFGDEPVASRPGAPKIEAMTPRMTEPVPEGWRAPSRVVPFRAPVVEPPPASAEPVRETLPELPPPAPLAGWMILAVVAMVSAGVSLWLVRSADRAAEPATETRAAVAATVRSEVLPLPVRSASATPVPSASAPAPQRRPVPARRSKPAPVSEIRDPWGAP